ncbi:MAG: twin-arginine translocation signal domain-containing protein, partial [Bacteroidales bacterium]|nr:twin-arginine translocation signal domain-containing protein [Bacteroidales bacterium]
MNSRRDFLQKATSATALIMAGGI